MKNRTSWIMVVVAAFGALVTLMGSAGCESSKIQANVEKARDVAQIAVDQKARLDAAIGMLESGTVTLEQFARTLAGFMNPEQAEKLAGYVAATGDFLKAGKALSLDLGTGAEQLVRELDGLIAKLETAQNKEQAWLSVAQWAVATLGTGGVGTIFGSLIGLARGFRKGEKETTVIFRDSIRAARIADEDFDKAIGEGIAGDTLESVTPDHLLKIIKDGGRHKAAA